MKIKKKSFEGKTIKTIDTRAATTLTFYFTDGTSVVLETESIGYGLHGFGQYTLEDYEPKQKVG